MALALVGSKNKAAQMSGLTEFKPLVSVGGDRVGRASSRQRELAERRWGRCQHRRHQGAEGEVHRRYVTTRHP